MARARLYPVLLAVLVVGMASARSADDYPSRPVRIIVPTAPGSAQDVVVRLLQPHLEKLLRQAIIVESRSGASTIVGTDAVAKAAPDGYTLLVEPTTFTVNAALNSKLPYDTERDFEPVAILTRNPLLFCINAALPARTLTEFVALAKAEPGKFNYATPGASSQAHLLIEMLNARAGITMQHIPYRGGARAALAVAAGEAHLVLLSPIIVKSHIAAGTLRPLATGGMVRHPDFPDLPTADETGFPGFEAVQWLGLLATGGTPKAIVERLNADVNRALREPDVIARLATQGTMAAGGTPEAFRELIAAEIRNWRDVARRANIETK